MKLLYLITLPLLISLVSCISPPPMPSREDVNTAIAQTRQSNFLIPTLQPDLKLTPTSLPDPTNLPLPTPTLSQIATVIAELKPIFEYARIYGVAHLQTGHLLITIEVPGDLRGKYQGLIGNEVFECSILPEYPNRLYCIGQDVHEGEIVQLSIIESRSQNTVFQEEVGIPPSPYTAQIVEVNKNNPENNEPIQPNPTQTPPAPAYPYP